MLDDPFMELEAQRYLALQPEFPRVADPKYPWVFLGHTMPARASSKPRLLIAPLPPALPVCASILSQARAGKSWMHGIVLDGTRKTESLHVHGKPLRDQHRVYGDWR